MLEYTSYFISIYMTHNESVLHVSTLVSLMTQQIQSQEQWVLFRLEKFYVNNTHI